MKVVPADNRFEIRVLADIFPTGWHATRLANLQPGQSIIILGAGPVGLTAAMSARIQGASQIFVADGQPDRLRLAREIGATPIDDKDDDVGEQIRAVTGRSRRRLRRGVRRLSMP
jgi:glutathione-independent formaldehyde dehydrogenase